MGTERTSRAHLTDAEWNELYQEALRGFMDAQLGDMVGRAHEHLPHARELRLSLARREGRRLPDAEPPGAPTGSRRASHLQLVK
jgi:hypothetical protein